MGERENEWAQQSKWMSERWARGESDRAFHFPLSWRHCTVGRNGMKLPRWIDRYESLFHELWKESVSKRTNELARGEQAVKELSKTIFEFILVFFRTSIAELLRWSIPPGDNSRTKWEKTLAFPTLPNMRPCICRWWLYSQSWYANSNIGGILQISSSEQTR